MLPKALWNFHMYDFPILKFSMQDAPLTSTTCANMLAIMIMSVSTILIVAEFVTGELIVVPL